MNFISNKHNGPIAKDFSIEKSFESFCTDSSMRSNYEEKLVEAADLAKEMEEKLKEITLSNIASKFKI